jgi:hypothetical protein
VLGPSGWRSADTTSTTRVQQTLPTMCGWQFNLLQPRQHHHRVCDRVCVRRPYEAEAFFCSNASAIINTTTNVLLSSSAAP